MIKKNCVLISSGLKIYFAILNKETKCPYGSQRFDSKKCIKYFGDEENIISKRFIQQHPHNSKKLNWHEAKQACESHHNGRLMMINDFVENLKLNAFIRDRLADTVKSSLLSSSSSSSSLPQTSDELNLDEDVISSSKISFWSTMPFLSKLNSLNIKLLENDTKTFNNNNGNKCMTKRLSFWQEESCESRQAYICEYDALEVNPKKKTTKTKIVKNENNNRNRLIRVACGTSATHFSSSETTSKLTTKLTSRQANQNKLLNSIKNTQKPFTNLFLPFNNNNKNNNLNKVKTQLKSDDDLSMMILTPKETS